MVKNQEFRVGEAFYPTKQTRTYYYAYFAIATCLLVLPYEIPLFLFASREIFLLITIPTIATLLFVAIWIPLYHKSIVYHLSPTEISWNRGVWFRQTGIVPFSRITNIDLQQGPLMRLFGFSSLRIQTAGYSAQASAEIRITGIEDPEPLRDLIMGYVRTIPPAATEGATGYIIPGAGSTEEIIRELREIKSLLEKIAEK